MVEKADQNRIEPGRVFTYTGPRRGLLLQRGLAVGKVIGVEPDRGIVHVRTCISGDSDEDVPRVSIGHIPILVSELLKSIAQLQQVGQVDVDCWETINLWRRRNSSGDIGAFATPLWKATRLAREALPEEARDRMIRYAFVKRSATDGKFSVVEVSAYDE